MACRQSSKYSASLTSVEIRRLLLRTGLGMGKIEYDDEGKDCNRLVSRTALRPPLSSYHVDEDVASACHVRPAHPEYYGSEQESNSPSIIVYKTRRRMVGMTRRSERGRSLATQKMLPSVANTYSPEQRRKTGSQRGREYTKSYSLQLGCPVGYPKKFHFLLTLTKLSNTLRPLHSTSSAIRKV